jgi:hypothetical protein
VDEDERVVVDIDDVGVRGSLLHDLVQVGWVGKPVPMSRNCRKPRSPARY